MKIYINLLSPNNDNNKPNKKSYNQIIKVFNPKSSKLVKYIRLNLLIITIPIISYCCIYVWKYYKKTKRLIDDYLETYMNFIKEKIDLLRNKMEKERIKNCNENLSVDLDIYKYFELEICLEIIHLKMEINKRFINLNHNELVLNKLSSLQNNSFEEYFALFNEIKKKIKINDIEIKFIFEDKLNISLEKINKKLNEAKEHLVEFNNSYFTKDFFTREKYDQMYKFNFQDFFKIKSLLNLFNPIKKERLEMTADINNYSYDNRFKKAAIREDLLDITIDGEESKYLISSNEISLYSCGFIYFVKIIIDKLDEVILQNQVDLCDPINVSKGLKKFTVCLLSFASDMLLEKYNLNIKNVMPVIIHNKFFRDEKITYFYEEFKSYLTKFKMSLIEI